MSKGPLSGYKVIEFATYVAAPSGVRLLADWGADVIKLNPQRVMTIAQTGMYTPCLAKVICTTLVLTWLV